jgi:hypothetical protein
VADRQKYYFHIVKTSQIREKMLNSLAWLTMLIWLIQVLGCGLVLEPPKTMKKINRPDPDCIALRTANDAMQNGDFKKALEGYNILQHSSNDKIARKARYGLVCAKLSLAKDPKKVREALMLWDAWSRNAPSDMEHEDPRILGPLLKSSICPKPNNTPLRPVVVSNEKFRLEKLLQAKEKEIQQLNDRLKGAENEIQTMLKNQADYVGVLESQIQTLRDKIKSLEAIDQKIKEKKKEVSSP